MLLVPWIRLRPTQELFRAYPRYMTSLSLKALYSWSLAELKESGERWNYQEADASLIWPSY